MQFQRRVRGSRIQDGIILNHTLATSRNSQHLVGTRVVTVQAIPNNRLIIVVDVVRLHPRRAAITAVKGAAAIEALVLLIVQPVRHSGIRSGRHRARYERVLLHRPRSIGMRVVGRIKVVERQRARRYAPIRA